MLLVFENDIAQVLSEGLEREHGCKRMSPTRAAEIVREYMFNNADLFIETLSEACQQRSVSPSLLTLVNMIPVGTNEISHEQGNQQAALSIAQLLKFNSIKHGRRSTDGSVTGLEIKFFLRSNIAPRSNILGANWFEKGARHYLTNIY